MRNKIHSAFESVSATPELKNSTLQFLRAEREKRSPRMLSFGRKRLLVTLCTLLILVIGAGGYYATMLPVSYVSIDVNPSVELALNRFDRVISATAYNEDGEQVLSDVKVSGQLYTQAIDTIVESAPMQLYLTEDSALTITVAAETEEKESAMMDNISRCSACQGHGGQSEAADMDTIAEAHENGLSFGKYKAYLMLSQYDDTITPQDCQTMTMAEIHEQISAHTGETGHYGDGSGNGNGAGNGNGNGCATDGHGEGHGKHQSIS